MLLPAEFFELCSDGLGVDSVVKETSEFALLSRGDNLLHGVRLDEKGIWVQLQAGWAQCRSLACVRHRARESVEGPDRHGQNNRNFLAPSTASSRFQYAGQRTHRRTLRDAKSFSKVIGTCLSVFQKANIQY